MLNKKTKQIFGKNWIASFEILFLVYKWFDFWLFNIKMKDNFVEHQIVKMNKSSEISPVKKKP